MTASKVGYTTEHYSRIQKALLLVRNAHATLTYFGHCLHQSQQRGPA